MQNACKARIHMEMGKRMGRWINVALILTALRDAPKSLMVTRPELVECLTPCFPYLEIVLAQLWEATKLTLKNVPPQHHSRNKGYNGEYSILCIFLHGDNGNAHSLPLPHKLELTQSSLSGLQRQKVALKGTLFPRVEDGLSFPRNSEVSTYIDHQDTGR